MAVTEPGADLAAVEAGLDALDLGPGRPPAPSRLRSAAVAVACPVAAIAVLIGFWQLIVTAGFKPSYVIPAPIEVWHTFTDQLGKGNVTSAIWTSMSRGALGFFVSIAIGTPLGLLMARVRVLRLGLGPLVASLQSLPSVTWVPFALLYFGANPAAIYFVVIMGAFPSIAGGMLAAVDQTPPLLNAVGRALGARGLAMYRHVIIPAALPGYVAGLKQAWAFSWRSLMAAEIITSDPDLGLGLGQLLHNGADQINMALVILSILLILVVGVAVESLVFAPLSRSVNRRRGLTGS
ncbi:MAG: ABC transporter permease [Chloroflexi bacterium]|nr:MAG: ABC transporter permease [Chloroflexota bacterium]